MTSEHRNGEMRLLRQRAKEIIIIKDGMALVLIPEGGLHSSRFTQHQRVTLLSHQDNQPSSKNHSSLTEMVHRLHKQIYTQVLKHPNLRPFMNTLTDICTGL